MEKLTFKVNEYEGPLDLILALLSKHQIEICDINISDLLEQYMACIRTLQEHQMEVASEFLEMASRLVYIKTASLLPREEKEEDPRAELVGQLLEYQSCKQAAALLRLLAQLAPEATCTLELMQDRPSLRWLEEQELLE